MDVEIYALLDPRSEEIRYVGKSVNPRKRIRSHSQRKGVNPHKDNWIGTLAEDGLEPKLLILEIVQGDTWEECERWWIRILRECGEPLTNITEGGDTGPDPTGTSHSAESRAKMSEARKSAWDEGLCGPRRHIQGRLFPSWLGRRHTEDTKQKMKARRRGRVVSEETRRRLSEAQRGREPHPNTLRALRDLADQRRGRPRSTQTKQKISASLKGRLGRKHTKESKRKMAEAKKRDWASGRYDDVEWGHSEDTKRKISDALRDSWARRQSMEVNDATN